MKAIIFEIVFFLHLYVVIKDTNVAEKLMSCWYSQLFVIGINIDFLPYAQWRGHLSALVYLISNHYG